MPASYETQIPNVITGSAQSTATQEAQPVAPKVNGDDDDDDDDKNILPQNLDANKFENIANRDDFDFNTKKFMKYSVTLQMEILFLAISK